MRILGIDPGIATTGYGIIDMNNNCISVVDYGIIKTDSKLEVPERLEIIYELLSQLIDSYDPDEVAIEELFFARNVKTAIVVGHARGVQILACRLKGLDVYEYTPLQVKQAVTGHGRADKRQVQEMVKILLNMKTTPSPDDAADALAIAIAHSTAQPFKDGYKVR